MFSRAVRLGMPEPRGPFMLAQAHGYAATELEVAAESDVLLFVTVHRTCHRASLWCRPVGLSLRGRIRYGSSKMRKTLKHAAAAAALSLLAASLVAISATPASASTARVPPASVQGECASDTAPIVVASDVAAQSDIYSAVTLAGVLGDACIVLAGARSEAMPADQQTRLDAAATGGYVVGGLAAVPDGKVAGRTMARLGGADRWATALLVGEEAADPGSAPRTSVAADVQFTPTPGSSSGTAATQVRLPPASVQGDCDSDTAPVVVASDLAAQSDIYSAVTLAGVLGDACIVLAGPRGEAMPADQQARLDAAAAGGYVVGGFAAVPDGKIADRAMSRIGGADRWATALLVGATAAASDTGTGTSTGTEDESADDTPTDDFPEIAAEHTTGYDRDDFGDHDASDLCQNATVGFFTGSAFGTIGCDVDHVVSLREAWESGAHAWTDAQRDAFSSDRDNLRPTLSCVNRSKGARDAAEWPRPVASGACEGYQATMQGCQQFKTITLAVKLKYSLTIDQAEHDALQGWDARCANNP